MIPPCSRSSPVNSICGDVAGIGGLTVTVLTIQCLSFSAFVTSGVDNQSLFLPSSNLQSTLAVAVHHVRREPLRGGHGEVTMAERVSEGLRYILGTVRKSGYGS